MVTYGNFRRPRVPGVLGLSAGVSLGLAVAALVLILLSISGRIGAALVWALVVVLAVIPMMLPASDGLTVYDRIARRATFGVAQSLGYTKVRQGPAGKVPGGKNRLPGLGAELELLDTTDPYGGSFGIIVVPSQHLYSVVIECHPWGITAVDQDSIEAQVAQWGGWLSSLGRDGDIAGASVTVESVPDSGYRLATAANAGRHDDAAVFASQVLDEAIATYPEGSAQIMTAVTVTWSATVSGGKPRSKQEMAAEIASRLPGIVGGLRGTGAGTSLRARTVEEIIDSTRAAYDPSAAPDIEEARAEGGTGIRWDEAGPVSMDIGYTEMLHDSSWSTSWQMVEPPRGVSYSTSLTDLLRPHHEIARKRVTILYRPEDPAASAHAVESGINLARWAASNQRRPSARVKADIAAAEKTAQEEALGAALVRFGVIVTATVAQIDDLALARQKVKSLAATARLQMRPAYGNQEVAFLAGLPLGIVLPRMTVMPSEIRDFF